jgi:hypothetical protein
MNSLAIKKKTINNGMNKRKNISRMLSILYPVIIRLLLFSGFCKIHSTVLSIFRSFTIYAIIDIPTLAINAILNQRGKRVISDVLHQKPKIEKLFVTITFIMKTSNINGSEIMNVTPIRLYILNWRFSLLDFAMSS